MLNFIANYSKKLTDDIDESLFDRTRERSIASFIVSGLKVMESFPHIKFVGYEHITDASKIENKLNRRHIKSKYLLKNKDIEKLVSIRDTAQEMLSLKFRIDYDGETRYVYKNLLIPAYIDRYHLLINGKKVLPQKQIVDTSTYTQKKSVKLKTTLTPIDMYKENVLFTTTDGVDMNVKTFILNLFTKEINPLNYYFAKFAAPKTIKYFGLQNVIDITNEIYNTDIFYYFRTRNKEMYVEVDKRFFDNNEFVRSFTYMVYDMFSSKDKFENADNVSYWTVRLGSIFTTNTKNQESKGNNVLISFERILDDITKYSLRLGERNLQSTYSLIRWMLGNFSELRKKDNHSLEMKRVRCNEVNAFYFIKVMTTRLNTLLNKKKITIESIGKIFNWNQDELFRNMISSKNSILKYNPDINNFDLLNGLRHTHLGKQGVTGGKNISNDFRDIHPSHLGRIDLNGISHGKNTCLTGFLVPKCELYDGGFFAEESQDPDIYPEMISKLRKQLKNDEIDEIKAALNERKELIIKQIKAKLITGDLPIRDGCIVIKKRIPILVNEPDNTVVIRPRNPRSGYVATYIDKDGLTMTEDKKCVIKRRGKLPIINGLYQIKASSIIDDKKKQ